MKSILRSAFICFLIGFSVIVTIQMCKTEHYVRVWQNRVASLEQREADIGYIETAQDYGRLAVESCRMLALENGLLCEREAKMTSVVAALQEENTKLKGAIAESVENMQAMLDENNDLHREINRLNFHVEVLENSLEKTQAALEAATEAIEVLKAQEDPTATNVDLTRYLKGVQYADEVVTALTVIL